MQKEFNDLWPPETIQVISDGVCQIHKLLPFGCTWPTGTFATSWICKRIAMPVAPGWFWMSQKTCLGGHHHPDTILDGESCLVVDLNENMFELHYLHTNTSIQFWVFCEWLDWAIRCLLPPPSWCSCRLDTEMSFDSQMSLNTSRLQTCRNEWNTFFSHVFLTCSLNGVIIDHTGLASTYVTNRKIFQTCGFGHFPIRWNQGINSTPPTTIRPSDHRKIPAGCVHEPGATAQGSTTA